MKLKKYLYKNIIPYIGNLTKRSSKIPVIYYHDVVEKTGHSFIRIDINKFTEQMEYLSLNNYKTYLFNEIPSKFEKSTKSKEIIITFDDGFISNYDIVFPLMKKLNLKFNIFLTTNFIGNKNYLTWQMIDEMFNSKLVGFGAHTHTHIDARDISEKNYNKEIFEVNNLICENIHSQINDFCFPYGYYNNQIITKLCNDEVYKRIYTSDKSPLKIINGCEIVGRLPINNDDDMDLFIKNIKGLYYGMYYYYDLKNRMKNVWR